MRRCSEGEMGDGAQVLRADKHLRIVCLGALLVAVMVAVNIVRAVSIVHAEAGEEQSSGPVISDITPEAGPTLGKQEVTITIDGLTPPDEPAYVQDGLVFHIDGVSNTRNGFDAGAVVWEDLSGRGNDVGLTGALGANDWQRGGFLFSDTKTFTRAYAYLSGIPFGADRFTMEANYYLNESFASPRTPYLVSYGDTVYYRMNALSLNTDSTVHSVWYANSLSWAVPNLTQAGTRHTLSTKWNGTTRYGYTDGALMNQSVDATKNTANTPLMIGMRSGTYLNTTLATGILLRSVRIYDRALSDAEIACNAALDRVRFDGASGEDFSGCPTMTAVDPSLTVTIGGKQCLNPQLADSATVTCYTAVHEAADELDVEVNYGGQIIVAESAYSYVDEFDITSISNDVGVISGGEQVTITGEGIVPKYAINGLVAYFDGVANTGSDNGPDAGSTSWLDLSGNGNNAELAGVLGANDWQQGGFLFTGGKYFTAPYALSGGLPFGTVNSTNEVSYHVTATSAVASGLFSYGDLATPNQQGFLFNNTNAISFGYGGSSSVLSWPSLDGRTAGTKRNLTSKWDGTTAYGYTDGAESARNALTKNTVGGPLYLGTGYNSAPAFVVTDTIIRTVRVYDRALSDREIACNAAMDRVRFDGASDSELAVCVEVKLGDGVCVGVEIVDEGTIRCTAPAHARGVVDVSVNMVGSEEKVLLDGYEYIDPPYLVMSLNKAGAQIVADPTFEGETMDYLEVTTETNWPDGYELTIAQGAGGSGLVCNAVGTPVLAVTSGSSSALDSNSWGVGMGTLLTPPNIWGPVSSVPVVVGSSDSAGIFTDYIYFGVRVNYEQRECVYSGTVVITAVMNP